jgi:hypothetical protein
MTPVDARRLAASLTRMHRGCLPAELGRYTKLVALGMGMLFNRIVWARGRATLFSGRHDFELEQGLRPAALCLLELQGGDRAAGWHPLLRLTEPVMAGAEEAEDRITHLAGTYVFSVVGRQFRTHGEFVRDYLDDFSADVVRWREDLTDGQHPDTRGWASLGERLDALVAPPCDAVARFDTRPWPESVGPHPTREACQAVEIYWTKPGHSTAELDRYTLSSLDRCAVEVVGRPVLGGPACPSSCRGFPTPAARLRCYVQLVRWACTEAGTAFERMTATGEDPLDPTAVVENQPEPEPGADDRLTAKQVVALIEKESPGGLDGMSHDSKRKWVSRLARQGVSGVKLPEDTFPEGGWCYRRKDVLAVIRQLAAKGFWKSAG